MSERSETNVAVDRLVSVPCFGTLYTSSWAGTLKQRVRVVGETPKRYRIEALKRTRLGGRRRLIEEGETALVPKFAVKLRAR